VQNPISLPSKPAVGKFNSIEASRSFDVEGRGLGPATCGFDNDNPNDLKQK
jgi:hypothetical protein